MRATIVKRAPPEMKDYTNGQGEIRQVTESMMQAMKSNLRPTKTTAATGGADAVRAAVAILGARGEVMIEDTEKGKGGQSGVTRRWVQKALQWAADQRWLSQEQHITAVEELSQYTVVSPHRATLIELGSGWWGAHEGIIHSRAWDRVVDMDKEQKKIGEKGLTYPAVLGDFKQGIKHPGGLVQWVMAQGCIAESEAKAVWASPACTEESLLQGFNKGKPWAKGKYGGVSELSAGQAVTDAVFSSVWEWWQRDTTRQYCVENVGSSAIQDREQVTSKFGTGYKVHACAYGRQTGKTYLFWMAPRTLREFQKLELNRKTKCKACKEGTRHKYTAAPYRKRGDMRQRPREQGCSQQAAANRVPPLLAEHIAIAMKRACEKETRCQAAQA